MRRLGEKMFSARRVQKRGLSGWQVGKGREWFAFSKKLSPGTFTPNLARVNFGDSHSNLWGGEGKTYWEEMGKL